MYVCKRYVVYGQVQGVGFRAFTQQVAQQHNLTGWVRNQATGSVEIMACGAKTAIKAFEAEIAVGPAIAKVDRVINEHCQDPCLSDFTIKQ